MTLVTAQFVLESAALTQGHNRFLYLSWFDPKSLSTFQGWLSEWKKSGGVGGGYLSIFWVGVCHPGLKN